MTGPATFEMARMGCRPPRVAIVVPGGEDWHPWARLGLYAAGRRWGGQGFILVPHHDGHVEPTLLELVSAYDPDFVVQLQPTTAELDAMSPDPVVVTQVDGTELVGDDRTAFLEATKDDLVPPDELDEAARQRVADVCTPHRLAAGINDETEDLTLLDTQSESPEAPALWTLAEVPAGPVLACPAEWTGPVALTVAASCGYREPPVADTQPQLDDASMEQLVRWLLARDGYGRPSVADPPYDLVWSKPARMSVKPAELPTAFDRTLQGLASVRRGFRPPDESVLVVGDTADDFALSLAWDRTYGRSVWIPSEMWPATGGAGEPLRSALELLMRRVNRRGALHLASMSLGDDELAAFASDCRLDDVVPRGPRTRPRGAYWQHGLPRLGPEGTLSLMVRGQFDRWISMPVLADEHGDRVLASPPPPLVPSDQDLTPRLPASWQIDFELSNSQMPRGRGIAGAALNEDTTLRGAALARSGRDGITYHSASMGFVPAGASLESTLARPQLRDLSLSGWVRVKARQAGYHVRPSAAGNRVAVLERLWGSREAMTDDVAGPLLDGFRAFVPHERRTTDAYPVAGDGVVLGPRQGFLSFAGMQARVGGEQTVEEIRQQIDRLLESGVLIRGLILGCGSCDRPSFIRIDRLAQDNECPRCASRNQLTQPRWRDSTTEPTWYYDLHWAMRQQLEQHGEVPLLLSHHLRSTTRRHLADVAELEFHDQDGGSHAEADLIAHVDDQLLVAEAKDNDTFGTGRKLRRAAAKRVELARTLRADEIVLATTRRTWQAATIEAVRQTIADVDWLAARAPRLRSITGLGSGDVSDEYVDAPDSS